MTTLIRAARLADGLSTSSQPNQAVLISDGRIRAVGAADTIASQTPPDTETIDLGDTTLTPGLIDGHTHLSLAGDGRSYVEMFSESDEMMVLTGAYNLRRHLDAAGLAKQKWPEELRSVSDFERTPSGKIKKFALRDALRRDAGTS